MPKIIWSGEILGVQPRIDLTRSFDQRQHSYLGYLLLVRGEAGGEAREFSVRIGPGAQAKHAFRAGDRVSGAAHPVLDPEREVAEFYKASALELVGRAEAAAPAGPPWRGIPPGAGSVPGARSPAARCARLCRGLPGVPVGLPHGRRDGHRPVEAAGARAPFRDFLLRAEIVRALPGGPDAQGAGAQGPVLGGGGLGGRGGDGASRQGRLSRSRFAGVRQRLRSTAIAPGALRHWERGDRKPRGATRVLLNVIARDPEAVLRVVRKS
jgi:hypothetical protein